MTRHGQAAMEFIMTYGWAMLVLLAMIGALAYFGVLNPNKYIPDKCLFPSGFQCSDYQATTNSGKLRLQAKIYNKGADAINITDAFATYSSGGVVYQSSQCIKPVTMILIDGNYTTYCDFTTSGPGNGQPVKLSMLLTYVDARGVFNHTITGEITTTVQ